MPPGIVKSRLDVIESGAPCKAPATTLIVMLPGAYDTPQDFVRHGFVTALRERNIAADIVMTDTHIGYFTDDLVVTRLHEDVIMPARQKGYTQIWLAGISLGGYGSLLYSRRHGEAITGMFLMAPFLGNRTLRAEIVKAGGLAGWQAGDVAPADYDRKLWAWLKGYDRTGIQSRHLYPRLYLGYGTEDRFASSSQALATVLPPAQVMTTHGGHDWEPWQRLWSDFLDHDMLPKCS
jgi:pimeloyl-ACP methyl ester carboxylesterase